MTDAFLCFIWGMAAFAFAMTALDLCLLVKEIRAKDRAASDGGALDD